MRKKEKCFSCDGSGVNTDKNGKPFEDFANKKVGGKWVCDSCKGRGWKYEKKIVFDNLWKGFGKFERQADRGRLIQFSLFEYWTSFDVFSGIRQYQLVLFNFEIKWWRKIGHPRTWISDWDTNPLTKDLGVQE